VSSLHPRRRPLVDPLPFSGPAEAARERLLAALRSFPRTRIVAAEGPAVRAECRSRFFGFVDELDFRIDETAGVIHVRSGCRFGFGDLGANRRRIARLRRAFAGGAPADPLPGPTGRTPSPGRLSSFPQVRPVSGR